MTPKEKAKELFDNFYTIAQGELIFPNIVVAYQAKHSALMCIKEIHKALNIPAWDGNPENSPEGLGDALYWEEVRKELEQM